MITINHKTYKIGNGSNSFIVNLHDHELNGVINRASFEIEEMKRIWTNISPNRTPNIIVDIGSNIGIYTIVFSAMFSKCRVVGFEPVPDNFKISLKNIEINNIDNVEMHNVGISSEKCERHVYLPWREKRINCGLYTTSKPEKYLDDIVCKFSRIDDILDSKKSIDIIKMDVEGCEYEIIKSHSEIFETCKMVHIEKNPTYAKNEEIDQLLLEYDFSHICTFKNNMIWSKER